MKEPTSEPMAPPIIIGALLSVALMLGMLGWFQLGPGAQDRWSSEESAQIRAGQSFPSVQIDERQIQRSRDAFHHLRRTELVDEEIEALKATYRELNLLQFPHHGDGEPPAGEELGRRAIFLANDVVSVIGVQGFQLIGDPIFDACHAGLDRLLRQLQRENLDFEQAQQDPPAGDFDLYRENCGNFLSFLHQRGLVNDSGEWTHDDAPEIARILQRHRWANLITEQYPIHYQWSPIELEVYYRWRFEDERAFSLAQRREFFSQARPYLSADYDLPLAKARLDAAGMSAEEAVLRFQQLVEEFPENNLYQAVYEQVRRQALTTPENGGS